MNIAQLVVMLSTLVEMPENRDWVCIVVQLGGYMSFNVFRFADGSMVTFNDNGLPIEYIGGFNATDIRE